MDVLILGGQSPRHYEWVRKVAEALRSRAGRIEFLDYRHWQTGDKDIDMENELSAAVALAAELDNYVIVAKSIGTVIATLAISRGLLRPRRCVFMGFPLALVQKSIPEVQTALRSLPQTAIVQNEADPLGTAEAVESYVEGQIADLEFYSAPGDTHEYLDFTHISQLALQE